MTDKNPLDLEAIINPCSDREKTLYGFTTSINRPDFYSTLFYTQ
ncbi:hypothetical protein ACQ4M3_07330 [Leptolyngbya sp. AN03gr2]